MIQQELFLSNITPHFLDDKKKALHKTGLLCENKYTENDANCNKKSIIAPSPPLEFRASARAKNRHP